MSLYNRRRATNFVILALSLGATGLGLLILPMVASGYLLQVAVAPGWRLAWAWVHGPASLLFLLAYLGHSLSAWAGWAAGLSRPAARLTD